MPMVKKKRTTMVYYFFHRRSRMGPMTHRKSNACSTDMLGSNVYRLSGCAQSVLRELLFWMSIAPLMNNSWLNVPILSTRSNDVEMSDVRSVTLARAMGR